MTAGQESFWKYTTAVSGGILATLFASWVTGSFDGVSEAQVKTIVKTQAPYLEDAGGIREILKSQQVLIAAATEDRKILRQGIDLNAKAIIRLEGSIGYAREDINSVKELVKEVKSMINN